MNYALLISMLAILFAQAIKYPIALLSKKRHPSIQLVTSTGGMPSSHSAAVSSLIMSLALEYGISSPYVSIATIFGVIVLFDSMGVRRQSGEQGIILNLIVRHHFEDLKEFIYSEQNTTKSLTYSHKYFDIEFDEYDDMIIDKYLGHKPTEVLAGTILGVIFSFIAHSFLF